MAPFLQFLRFNKISLEHQTVHISCPPPIRYQIISGMVKVSPSCYCQLVTVVAIVPDDFDDCNCPNENCLRGRNRQYNVHTRTFYNHSQLKEQNKKYNLSHCKHQPLWPHSVKLLHGCLEWMMLSYKWSPSITLGIVLRTHGKLSTSN